MSDYAQQIEFLLAPDTDAALGTVEFYLAGTSTLASVYLDRTKNTPASNPFTLTANGSTGVPIYADGVIKITKKNSAGAILTNYPKDNLSYSLQNGPWVDVAGYASLTAAVSAIGSTVTELLIDGATTLTTNTTVPATMHLRITSKGSINQGAYTLTINGNIESPKHQIFTGTGSVLFGGVAREIPPEWWGAKNDGTSKATTGPALLAAFQSVVSGNHVLILEGLYATDRSLTSNGVKSGHNHSWGVVGKGESAAILNQASASNPTFSIVGSTSANEPYNFSFKNFAVYGDTTYPNDGIYIEHGHMWTMENMEINANGRSLYVKGSIYPTIRKLKCWASGATGGTGAPTTEVVLFAGDATYPVNALKFEDFTTSPTGVDGLKLIHCTNAGANVGISHQLKNIVLEAGGTDAGKVSGIYYDQPSLGGYWEKINIDGLHIEGVAVASNYAVLMHSVRRGTIKHMFNGSATGQLTRLDNCTNVTVEKSSLGSFLATPTCEYCGICDSVVSDTYTNSSARGTQINLNSTIPPGIYSDSVVGVPSSAYPTDASNFGANDGATWTVDAADVGAMSYKIDNNVLMLNISALNTTVSAATPTQLTIKLPNGMKATKAVTALISTINNGSAPAVGHATVAVDATSIAVFVNLTGSTVWALSTNQTSITGQIVIPVTAA